MLNLFTFTPNSAHLTEIQLGSLRKNLREEFQLTVFNNAQFGYDRRQNNTAEYTSIAETCKRLNIPMISVQKDPVLLAYCEIYEPRIFDGEGFYCNGNVAHAFALMWAWRNVISRQKGVVCIIDFDMFLKTPTKLSDFAQEADLSFIAQSKPGLNGRLYMWPGFVLINMDRLPEPDTMNWMCGRIEGIPVDVGGHTNAYLEAHPELKTRHLGMNNFPDDSHVDYQVAHLGDVDLLHYRAGSNWDNNSPEFHKKKTEWVRAELGL